MNPVGLAFLIGGGAFGIVGACYNWDWFMNHRKARCIVALFGRQGARIFYAILGAALIAIGILFALGVIKD